MPDMTHVIMEQAMKYGRTFTVKAADAMVTGPAGQAVPQMVHLELRCADGGPERQQYCRRMRPTGVNWKIRTGSASSGRWQID